MGKKAVFNDVVIAESDNCQQVEGNFYFPPDSLKKEYFSDYTGRQSTCPWKGLAEYHDITVGEKKAANAAWVYPTPKEAAANIKNHVAFYISKGIDVRD